MSILQDILKATKSEVDARRARRSADELRRMTADAPPVVDLYSALSREFGIIAEIKVMSPSAGPMDPGNVERAAKVYENSPAVSALSVITQERYFGGDVERLWQSRQVVTKPILRKDFIFDRYQVIEARAFGADAVLLMASVFVGSQDGKARLDDLYGTARELGMDALFEIGMSDHPVDELAAVVPSDARIWGANCRQFHSSPFKVRAKLGRLIGQDLTTSIKRHMTLRSAIPAGVVAVAESGVETADHLVALSKAGYNAALIGTSLLRSGTHVEDAVDRLSDAVMTIRSQARHGSL